MKTLNLGELFVAAHDSGMPNAENLKNDIEAACTIFGAALARHLGIDYCAATEEGEYGIYMSFAPKYLYQSCPEVIEDGDPGGDWENDDQTLRLDNPAYITPRSWDADDDGSPF